MASQVKFCKKFLFLLFFFLGELFVFSQENQKTYNDLPEIYKKAFKVNSQLKSKDSFELYLETFNGYSIYKETFEVKSSYQQLKLKQSTPSFQGLDPITQKIKEFYKGQNTFLFETVDKKIPSLTQISVKLQACSKDNCLLPVLFSIPIVNPEIKSNPISKIDPPESSLQERLAQKLKSLFQNSSSLISLPSLLILFLAGLITSFSPCVMPLFPITLGIFSRWSHHDQKKAFALSLSYGLGIILCYAAHGLLSAATGGVLGA